MRCLRPAILCVVWVCAFLVGRASANVPINDLGTGLYLGQYQGGLYPNGLNVPPPAHAAAGIARAQAVQPRDIFGNLNPSGKHALISIGMSNTTQEFCSGNGLPPPQPWTFMGQAAVHPNVNKTTLAIVNGAKGGKSAASWVSPGSPEYNRIINEWLTPNGLTEAQVQVAWVKVANPQPTDSLATETESQLSDARRLVQQMGNIARTLKTRYPNMEQVFLSSRIYAGYATTTLNPEPYAYESGFAVKWLIEAQIKQMETGIIDPLAGDLNYETGAAPWLGWGAYLWADGTNPRSDGRVWHVNDLAPDGTHPSMSGAQKVGTMLMNDFLHSPFTQSWFVPEPSALSLVLVVGLMMCHRRATR